MRRHELSGEEWAIIAPRIIRKGSFAFSTRVYRQRNLVERFFNQVKQFRGLATRYDRNPENDLAYEPTRFGAFRV